MVYLFLVPATLSVAIVIGILSLDTKLATTASGLFAFWLSLLLHLTDPTPNVNTHFFWEAFFLVVGAGLAAAFGGWLARSNDRHIRADLHARTRITTSSRNAARTGRQFTKNEKINENKYT